MKNINFMDDRDRTLGLFGETDNHKRAERVMCSMDAEDSNYPMAPESVGRMNTQTAELTQMIEELTMEEKLENLSLMATLIMTEERG